MKSLIAVILFSTFFLSLSAKDDSKTPSETRANIATSLAGTVKDKSTGEYLVGAEVKIEGTNLKTLTDFDGNFVFDNIKPGTYNVSVNFISYEKVKLENFKIGSKTNMLELELHQLK